MREGFPGSSASKESSWNVRPGFNPCDEKSTHWVNLILQEQLMITETRHQCTYTTLWIGRYRQTVCVLSHFGSVQLFAIPRTVVHQTPLSMGSSRQEYWSALPRPPPGDLPDPGWNLRLLYLLHWQSGSSPLAPPGKPIGRIIAPKDNFILEPVNKSGYIAKRN